jgi:hypothetical protein
VLPVPNSLPFFPPLVQLHMAFWYNPNSLKVTASGVCNPQIFPVLL